jgi:hypothetical protein
VKAPAFEEQVAATRRKNSIFRRRTNTYAKTEKGLQRTLDVQQLATDLSRDNFDAFFSKNKLGI